MLEDKDKELTQIPAVMDVILNLLRLKGRKIFWNYLFETIFRTRFIDRRPQIQRNLSLNSIWSKQYCSFPWEKRLYRGQKAVLQFQAIRDPQNLSHWYS